MSFLNSTEIQNNSSTPIKTYSSYEGDESLTWKLLKSVALGVLILMSLVGNSLVVGSVVRNCNKRMRTVSNLLIVNTSLSYLLITVVNMPELIYRINATKPLLIAGEVGSHLCRLKNFAPFLSVSLATQSFAILAVDRFIAVFYPLRRINHKTAYVLIALTWVTSFAFGWVYIYGSALITFPKIGIVCAINIRKSFNSLRGLVTYVWVEFSFFYMVPLVLASGLYTSTIIRLWRPKINRKTRGPFAVRFSGNTNKNAIKMLITVLILFSIAWLPLWVYTVTCRGNFTNFLGHPICKSGLFIFLIYFIGYSQGALAPFIYPIFSQNFRMGFKDCLSFLKRCTNRHVNNGASVLEMRTLPTKTGHGKCDSRGVTNLSMDLM
ncbi:neuropeptide FF receptor 2-like [Actinia tenebrosa]|uniref:Neuropeptide FF receptor 2-like n=1 Tax=Actinia tenebrosa TaxID=6105 RepID=A0A6P8I3L6_ACTTE|nr:neuropeptide FF receptor 2-like [Actinia tenebrosa]